MMCAWCDDLIPATKPDDYPFCSDQCEELFEARKQAETVTEHN